MGYADRIACLNKMHLKFGVTVIVIRCITEQVGNDAMSSNCHQWTFSLGYLALFGNGYHSKATCFEKSGPNLALFIPVICRVEMAGSFLPSTRPNL